MKDELSGREPSLLDELVSLPRDDGGPTFHEPWEAQAFALAVQLSRAGYFTWKEWATALGREIKTAQDEGDPDRGDTYYRHWLRALEGLCAEKGLVGPQERARRREQWRRAYLNTPHGRPIELQAGLGADPVGED